MKPGIYTADECPMDTYVAFARRPDVVTSSTLANFTRSPAASQVESEPTDATDLGVAKHTRVTHPDEFKKVYPLPAQCCATKADKSLCTKPGKVTDGDGHWYCLTKSHAPEGCIVPSGTVLTPSKRRQVDDQAQAVLTHPESAGILLASPDREVTKVWSDPRWPDLTFAARADILNMGKWVYDLKFWADCTRHGFTRDVVKRGGHMAAHHYMTAFDVPTYGWIACDNRPPHEVAIYHPSPDFLAWGKDEWEQKVGDYDRCYRAGDFPGYESGIIDRPAWAGRDDGGGESDDPWF